LLSALNFAPNVTMKPSSYACLLSSDAAVDTPAVARSHNQEASDSRAFTVKHGKMPSCESDKSHADFHRAWIELRWPNTDHRVAYGLRSTFARPVTRILTLMAERDHSIATWVALKFMMRPS